MKVEKDLRETDGVQDERRNGKTGGNSARSFAVLTLCAVLAMVISLGTRTFAESEGGRVDSGKYGSVQVCDGRNNGNQWGNDPGCGNYSYSNPASA